jgi:large subunit ribosomal protein L18
MATVKARTARRQATVRRAIKEAATGRARLSVHRSSKHIYAQVIDDATGQTLAHASTLSKDLRGTLEEDNKVAAAKKVGALIAKICKTKKIDKVVFDRNGYMYHGRVSALAQAAREAGLEF